MPGITVVSPNEQDVSGHRVARRPAARHKRVERTFLIEEVQSVRDLRQVWSFGHTVMVRMRDRGAEVSIIPANTRFSIDSDDTGPVVAVGLKAAFVACSAAGPGRAYVQLRHVHGIEDALIVELVRALRAETGKPASALFVQTLASALAMRVVSKYGPDSSVGLQTDNGLGRQQLGAVLDYINENLAVDLGISDLACIAGLSLSHFIRVFKLSTGASPHQYLLRTRLGRAQELLSQTRYSIADIAQMTGFCGQSHFTKHFRRLLGTTPRRYRQKTSRPTA